MLFISAAALISGQQRKTEFTQAVRDLESRLSDISNDVSTGLYTNTNNFQCQVVGTTLTISSGTNQQGGNTGCIYLGKVLQFSPDTGTDKIRILSVVGKQRTGNNGVSGTETTSLTEATPQAIAPGSSPRNTVPDGSETIQLGGGANIGWVRSKNGAVESPIAALGLLSSFASYSAGHLDSGALQVDTYSLGSGPGQSLTAISDMVATNQGSWYSNKNPNGGTQICVNSGGGDQHAILTIGGTNRQQFVNTVIANGGCP